MNSKKIFLSVAMLLCSSVLQAKTDMNSGELATVMAPCMIQVSSTQWSRYINANLVRYVDIVQEKPTQVNVSLLGNHSQINLMSLTYPSKQEAIVGMNALVKQMNDCRHQP